MRTYLGLSVLSSLACVLAMAACDNDPEYPNGTGGSGLTSSSSSGMGGEGGASMQKSRIRVHYRLQDGGDPKTWGLHFWGAAANAPQWLMPQMFTDTDAFGAYTDIEVTETADTDTSWVGMLPVQCGASDCKKDVETSARFVDLTKNAADSTLAECWITQGQAISATPPAAGATAYKVSRPKDYIDLGDGRVRMMFRVAKGSTGKVEYGTASGALTKQVSWTESDDINKDGLILPDVGAGKTVYYKISTDFVSNGMTLSDSTAELSLTTVAFTPITDTADWASWGEKGVMYQLIVRTFADGGTKKDVADGKTESGIDTATKDGIGDLVGLRQALPYLKDLGIDAIWMTPVFNAKSYHGYDTTDFYSIHPEVGTIKDFEDLTAAAHAEGINIILDLVENHVADVNPWFVKGANPKDPEFAKYHDWFVWSDEYSNMLTDKHPWDANELIWACKNYMCYHKIFGGSMPELNYHNPEVRAEMKKIAKYWIDLGADGYRLDASKHIDQFDDNAAIPLDVHGTHVWWKEFNAYVKKDVPRPAGSAKVLLTGENRWDDPASYGLMVPYGSDMDSQFDFPFRSIVGAFASGQTGAAVDFVGYMNKLKGDLAAGGNGGNANHFLQRFLSNHDLDRPATQLEPAGAALPFLLKQAATIVMTVPGMPVIYYGEEVGKKGKRDKYTGMEQWDRDEFIREPMSWFQDNTFTGDKMASWDIDFAATNQANAALALTYGITTAPNPDYKFIKFMAEMDTASWEAQKDDPNSLLSHYKKLITIRKANAPLTDTQATMTVVKNTADVYEYTLTSGAETIRVILNRKSTNQAITIAMSATDQLSGVTGTMFDVPPYGALILK